jgi:hypothetical protein
MPFIQQRLSNKTVESIWTEAADSVVCNQSGCHNKATKVWDTPVKGSQVGYCDEHEGPATKAQPKTAKAKVFKSHDGKSWGVACNTNECRSVRAMEGLTHDGATQQAAAHNQIHHSKSSSDGFTSNPHYEGWDGKDPMATTPKPGPDCNCERCVNDPYSPRNRAKIAFTHDEIDWTDVEPGSPECASYRPSDRDETMRIVRKEDDRRQHPRDTPDRREVSQIAGFHPGQEYGFGKFDDDILEDYTESPDCLECGKPIASSSVAKGWGDLQFCDKSCENKWMARPSSEKFASRKTARFTWDGPAGF